MGFKYYSNFENMKHYNKGTFIISLDFELMWGIIDIATPNDYGRSNVAQVREVIRRLINVFDEYNVKATFASVGMLMLDGVDAIKTVMPVIKPSYSNDKLSPYLNGYMENINEIHAELYFAPDLIELLKESNNIEIGTHTFCHYYCNEKGQTLEQFEADLKTAINVANDRGLVIKSIIFPRNQVTQDYLAACAKYGIEAYRGNPKRFFSYPTNKLDRIRNQLGRMLDAYLNVGGHTSYSYDTVNSEERPLNIKASRFFRPYERKLSFLEPLRLRRIKKELLYAAKKGEIYHLWWHPHNFGNNLDENFSNLRNILDCYVYCRDNYGMTSMTMCELAERIKNEKKNTDNFC